MTPKIFFSVVTPQCLDSGLHSLHCFWFSFTKSTEMKNKLSIPGKSLQSIKKLNLFSHFCLDLFRECYAFPSPITCDAPLARSSQNSQVLTIWGSIQTCLRLYVIYFFGQIRMCFQQIHMPRKTVGPKWRACGFQTSFFPPCVMTSRWHRGRLQPVKESPVVLLLCSTGAIYSLIRSLKKDSLSVHCFLRVRRGQQKTAICLWPQCTFSLGQCSFS